ncbi:MAG: MogA/MoaB family molybdenum cofactor biosynthesis protein [Desulfurococcaceae archaeon]
MQDRNCFRVIVVSDMIYEGRREDISGELAVSLLKGKGICVSDKTIVKNSYRDVLRAIKESNERVVILLGGTGPSPRDITVDVVEELSWRCLPGFGEIFRQLSFQKIGTYTVLTRTSLCILYDGKIVIALPGSPDAVSLGVDLLSQFIEHLIEEVDRYEKPHREQR